jgi:hypothetical protein
MPGLDSFGNMDDREKLRQHFLGQPGPEQTNKWDGLWQQGTTPWDRSVPSPALIDALSEKADTLGAAAVAGDSKTRKRALVPGCGRGYDVLLFSSHGYDAYGLDASQTAIDYCKALAQEQGDDNSKYPVKDEQLGRGEQKFVYADFFKDDFLAQTNGGKFDVIYDYTFLCALPPDMRPRWSKRMSELLAFNGHLICLEFPLTKPPTSGGPPHGLSSELYVELFKRPGEEVNYDQDGYVKPDGASTQSQEALVRVDHWQPARSHQVGAGSDRVSIWKHASS